LYRWAQTSGKLLAMILPTTCASDRPPVVSVVIASHNYAHYLPDAIHSVQAQSFQDWECIIVDDASIDNTPDVVAEFMREDPRIQYIRNPENLGEGGTRNLGNSMARGEFIAVLDADDWWDPEKLESQLGLIRRVPGAILCFTDKINVFSSTQRVKQCDPVWLRNIDRGLHLENEIVHSSVLVSRFAVEAVKGYDPSLPPAADWDLWLRLMHCYRPSSFVHVDKPLVSYRVHDNNMTANWRGLIRSERRVLQTGLTRGAWALRNPRCIGDALSWQLLREGPRYSQNGYFSHALVRDSLLVALAPWRRWRWQRLTSQLARWRGRVSKPATLG